MGMYASAIALACSVLGVFMQLKTERRHSLIRAHSSALCSTDIPFKLVHEQRFGDP